MTTEPPHDLIMGDWVSAEHLPFPAPRGSVRISTGYGISVFFRAEYAANLADWLRREFPREEGPPLGQEPPAGPRHGEMIQPDIGRRGIIPGPQEG